MAFKTIAAPAVSCINLTNNGRLTQRDHNGTPILLIDAFTPNDLSSDLIGLE